VDAIALESAGRRPTWGSFKSRLSQALPHTHMALAGSNRDHAQTASTAALTTNTVQLIASRIGDAFLGYFLSLGQEVTRRLRRRNSPRPPRALLRNSSINQKNGRRRTTAGRVQGNLLEMETRPAQSNWYE
ncbi:hypothetical protein, partial [Cupriavidus sp. UYPR2.512]|uniref:hypothetical protein n=1 Tax=Cupriavidus sp. UYPR2.512 TaxID=1080187 RepID=UPI001E6182A7